MHARSIMMAAASLTFATQAAAEPPKTPAVPSAGRPTPVIYASADQIVTPAPTPERPGTTTVKRPRAARVTTCRCGDPQPEPQEQQ
jgi:hypothetical protein